MEVRGIERRKIKGLILNFAFFLTLTSLLNFCGKEGEKEETKRFNLTKEVCDGIDNDYDGKVDEADLYVNFERYERMSPGFPQRLASMFKSCFDTNPSYPYKVTYSLPDYSMEVSYIVINSEKEWKELCKNETFYNAATIAQFYDFSAQTIIGFVFQSPNILVWSSCSPAGNMIKVVKVHDSTLYVGWFIEETWGDFGCYVVCAAVQEPPYYDAIVINVKLNPQKVVVREMRDRKDFCPYIDPEKGFVNSCRLAGDVE